MANTSKNLGEFITETLQITNVISGSTATEVLVLEPNGMVNTSPLSTITGGVGGKYVESFSFTAATTSTITHGLVSTDIMVQLKDSTGQLIIPDVVNNYTTNTVDIKVSSTETMRIIIIG